MNLLNTILDGKNTSLGDGALLAIIAILLVFVILAIIIGATTLANILIKKIPSKKVEEDNKEVKKTNDTKLLENDNDAMVAALVASVDYRNEIKKDVKVVNVKEIK